MEQNFHFQAASIFSSKIEELQEYLEIHFKVASGTYV